MLGAASIARVKLDLHSHTIANCRPRRLSHHAAQVQIERAVTRRHHINPPALLRFAVDPHPDRKRLPPAWLDGFRSRSTHEDKRVDPSNLDRRGEGRSWHERRLP